jgi:RND family efflux transporter MFP subunit
MSGEVRSDLDLAGLQRPALRPPPRRRFGLVVALAIVLAFLAVLAGSARDLLVGATPVTIVRPAPTTGATASAAVLVQAAGWVEPDPFPFDVPALVPGVVRDVLVQESEPVHGGDPVAWLVDDEARLALRAAQAGLQRAQAESARAAALAALEQQRFDAALEVTADADVARAEEALAQASCRAADAAAAGAGAAVDVGEAEVALQFKLAQAGGAGLRQVELAQARLAEARAARDEKLALAQAAAATSRAASARRTRAEGELELRTADRARLQEARSAQSLAEADLADALAARDRAALALERTSVRAPRDGVVLARLVAPGAVLDGGSAGAAVVTQYDPSSLRVRVDVPQSQVGRLVPGQACEILSESRPGRPYPGELLRVVQRADIQKVTLQAHVRVRDGDGLLRPEMLVQVRFLGAAGEEDAADSSVLLPAAVLDTDGGRDAVWIVDPVDGRARRREVQVVRREADRVQVAGLDLSVRVIDTGRAGLSEGARVAARDADD